MLGNREQLVFFLNGQRCSLRGDTVALTLADYLRQRQGLPGTKIVCNEGDCGACSVLVGRPDATGRRLEYRAIDACIAFLFQLDRTHIVTVEGLAVMGELTAVQAAMVNCHGSQCGFCTPGFVTAMHGMIESSQSLDDDSMRYGLSGNLCRCTGYVQILEAGKSIDAARVDRLAVLYADEPMVQEFASLSDLPVQLELAQRTIYLPQAMQQAAAFLATHPTAEIVSGATDYGVLHNHGRTKPKDVVCLSNVADGRQIDVHGNVLSIGALATWIEIERSVKTILPKYHAILTRFGSPQIRQMGTIGGNLASGSPIADCVPLHLVLDAEIELISVRGTRRVPLSAFYLGYRQTALHQDELIAAIHTPLPQPDERLKLYKISKRRDMDISTLTFAIWLRCNGEMVRDIRVVVGGVGPTVLRLTKAENALRGQSCTEPQFREAGRIAKTEVSPWTDVRGSADYRAALTENLFIKFFLEAESSEYATP